MPNLLIVDDDLLYTESLKASVDWAGLGVSAVFTADTLEKAESLLAERKIDIVLCDIEMPGSSGFELLNWIRGKGAATQFIFLTGHAEFTYAQRALKMGCQDYILKSAVQSEVEAAIKNAWGRIRLGKDSLAFSRYAEHWDKQSSLAVHQFWRDIALLAVDSDPENLEKEAAARKIPFFPQMKLFPVVAQFSPEKPLSLQEEAELEYTGKGALKRLLASGGAGQVVKTAKNTFLLLLDPERFPGETAGPELDAAALECAARLGHTCVALGYGTALTPAYLADFYELASLRLISRAAPKTGAVSIHTAFMSDAAAFRLTQLLEGMEDDAFVSEAGAFLQTALGKDSVPAVEEYFFHLLRAFLCYAGLRYGKDKARFAEAFQTKAFYGSALSLNTMTGWLRNALQSASAMHRAAFGQDPVLLQAKKYVQAHLGEVLSRETISEYVHMNPDYLNRLFKKNIGTSLMEYVSRERIRVAKELLKTGQPIGEISTVVGYENFSNFANMFRKHTGMSPSLYRRSLKQQASVPE